METIFGLKPTQLAVFGLVSAISVVVIRTPWLWLALGVCFVVAVILQQRNIKQQRQLAKLGQLSEDEITDLCKKAFAGEFPITSEKSPFGKGEVLMFEPTPGHKIVIGSVGNGKATDQH